MKTACNPVGQTVYFDEKEHKYFVGDKVLTSVTTFVSKFFPVFDSQLQAERYAKKHRLKVENVLADWERVAEVAEDLGNDVHAYAEAAFKGLKFTPASSQRQRKEYYWESIDKAIHKLKERFEFVDAERIIFSVELGLAGMIDLLMIDKANSDLVIFDWKTSKKIEKENFWQTGFPPVEHLQDCNFNHYQLQLNLYEHILKHEEYTGLNIRKVIIHLKEDGVEWHKVGDLQADVANMIKIKNP